LRSQHTGAADAARHGPEIITTLAAQVQLPQPSWRVDFFLVAFSIFLPSKPIVLVVECDGHEFHERTPGQAERDRSRDREAQLRGLRILRFTGREIWRDAAACAKQVDDVICAHSKQCAGEWTERHGKRGAN
jgi:very-short-patch-repair endonuclease